MGKSKAGKISWGGGPREMRPALGPEKVNNKELFLRRRYEVVGRPCPTAEKPSKKSSTFLKRFGEIPRLPSRNAPPFSGA